MIFKFSKIKNNRLLNRVQMVYYMCKFHQTFANTPKLIINIDSYIKFMLKKQLFYLQN